MNRNKIFTLEGRINNTKKTQPKGGRALSKNETLSVTKVRRLAHDLQEVSTFWANINLLGGGLVSVYYDTIIPKGKRIVRLFKARGAATPNDCVVGAKFDKTIPIKPKHVITYFVPVHVLVKSSQLLSYLASFIDTNYNGVIDDVKFQKILKCSDHKFDYISRTALVELIYELIHVEKFTVNREVRPVTENTIVTLYKTANSLGDILKSIDIELLHLPRMGENTFLFTPAQMNKLQTAFPYLIAMQVSDFSKISLPSDSITKSTRDMIPPPKDEPIVGVIDTPFYEDAYFKEWVDAHNLIPDHVTVSSAQCAHGTEVSSIIVDGPSLNPDLDDECGRFRVRHFGIFIKNAYSTYEIMNKIKDIVISNPDIKVWNLSLGSIYEVQDNSISPEASMLDKLQSELDVVFIVSGTNKPKNSTKDVMKIGAPADSLNSVVVNSVSRDQSPAPYARSGPVLSFFHKPDVSYYGGTNVEPLQACSHIGGQPAHGTSFAAPWIARKMAYLIHKMHLPREAAKALLIHSAAAWDWKFSRIDTIGYGVVPVKISDILTTSQNEIRFILYSTMTNQMAYSYEIPVPLDSGKYPFAARATLCYFPSCTMEQGVDYTNTEMQLKFGRVKYSKNNSPSIISIDGNRQGEEDLRQLYEIDARNNFRKWDNVKHIADRYTSRSRAKKQFEKVNWGLQITSTQRIANNHKNPLHYAVVITLRELSDRNRYDDFVKRCRFEGWNVNEIDINMYNQIFAESQADVFLE